MRRGSATTLTDVAKEAGVAPMTVSVVLNGAQSGTRVSETTRARIHEAAQRLNYRPNGMARGLVQRKVDTIGIVSPIDKGDTNLYFLEVLNGILEATRIHNQNTTLMAVSGWSDEAQRILKFSDGRIDAMVLIAPLLEPSVVASLVARLPVATIHANYEYEGAINIFSDDAGGAYEATKYLISQGHRLIAHFSGPEAWSGGRQRKEGFLRAMQEAGLAVAPHHIGLAVAPHHIMETGFSTSDGRTCMKALLDAFPVDELPTAIFCGSDAVAFGCMQVLAEAGISVPDQMSIVGFDDNMLSRLSRPEMTTIQQPFYDMARRAITRLVDEVTTHAGHLRDERGSQSIPLGESKHHTHTEILPVELIIRGSVKRLE